MPQLWEAAANDTPPQASLSRVWNKGVSDVYRRLVLKLNVLREEASFGGGFRESVKDFDLINAPKRCLGNTTR